MYRIIQNSASQLDFTFCLEEDEVKTRRLISEGFDLYLQASAQAIGICTLCKMGYVSIHSVANNAIVKF